MKIVVQRVKSSSVSIGGELVSEIGMGMMILVGVRVGDTPEDVDYAVRKAANLRIFDDENGVMNRSVIDVGGEVLAVSQFTMNASTKKGNRPSYIYAAGHELAVPLYEMFCEKLEAAIGK